MSSPCGETAPFEQAPVAGEEDPAVLGARALHQVGVFHGPLVGGVVAQDPQPAGQLPEHAVGEKPRIIRHRGDG